MRGTSARRASCGLPADPAFSKATSTLDSYGLKPRLSSVRARVSDMRRRAQTQPELLMPMMGRFRRSAPDEPKNAASPNAKTPPSDATSQ